MVNHSTLPSFRSIIAYLIKAPTAIMAMSANSCSHHTTLNFPIQFFFAFSSAGEFLLFSLSSFNFIHPCKLEHLLFLFIGILSTICFSIIPEPAGKGSFLGSLFLFHHSHVIHNDVLKVNDPVTVVLCRFAAG